MRPSFKPKTQQLVALAKDGDRTALNQLYTVYAERIQWLVRLRMGKELRSKLESMDLAQDVIIRALQGLREFTYENEGDFVRWLSKIAENAFRDNLDKLYAGKRDIRKEVTFDNNGSTMEGEYVGSHKLIQTTTPSMIVSKREDLARLEKAIDTLKPEYREVLVLAKIEGLSYDQIGNQLGKTVGAVKMLVSRATVALASAFGKV